MEAAVGQDLSEAFSTIIEYFPSGISLIDGDLHVVAWNTQFKQLLKFPDDLFQGDPLPMERFLRYNALRGDYGPGDPEQLVNQALKVCSLRQPHLFERTRLDGTVLEIRGLPLPSGGFVTIYTDITERRMAELQYRAILSNASIGILFTRDQRVMQCNEKFAEIFGWSSPEALKGQPGSVFWPSAEAYEVIGSKAGAILSKGQIFSIQCPMRWQDGSSFLCSLTAKAMDPVSTAAGTIWIAQDITDQVKAQQRIHDSARLLTSIVDGNPVPTFVINSSHTITHWNHACETLTGHCAEDMIGTRDSWKAFYQEPRQTMADMVVDGATLTQIASEYGNSVGQSKLIAGAYEFESFFPAIEAGGSWFLLTAAPLRDAEGKTIGAIETIRDTTTHIEAEHALHERTQELEKALQELGQVVANLQLAQDELVRNEKLAALGSLVAGVSHELNTPIGNALVTATSLQHATQQFTELKNGALTRTALESFMSTSLAGADLLVRTIGRAAELIGSFKQLAADQTFDQCRLFSLDEIIADVSTAVAPKLRGAPYELQVHAADGDIMLNSYPGALSATLLNFINNALLHGFDGRPKGVMTIRSRLLNAHEVEIVFSDDGVGMPAQVCKRIFEPFFTTKLGQGGSGLGMHVAYNTVVSVLGGSIEVHSIPGAGTSCRLVLPLTAPPRNAKEKPMQ
nr:PAS-domain containing protein [uncultured Rhodoferax sp.]